jgi:DNA-binding XRE family transcriptional regulator
MKWKVLKKIIYKEAQLASLAKKFRVKAGKTKAEAARELDVSRSTIQHAEGYPEKSLTNLRCRMIEKYSSCRVIGPKFWLEQK